MTGCSSFVVSGSCVPGETLSALTTIFGFSSIDIFFVGSVPGSFESKRGLASINRDFLATTRRAALSTCLGVKPVRNSNLGSVWGK